MAERGVLIGAGCSKNSMTRDDVVESSPEPPTTTILDFDLGSFDTRDAKFRPCEVRHRRRDTQN